jgi:hypothetical protein
MNLFKKFFGINDTDKESDEHNKSPFLPEEQLPIDERFIKNFKHNGGKFLYCLNMDEVREQFENILLENDWYESNVLCYDSDLWSILSENKLTHNPKEEVRFMFTSCEYLVANDGSIVFSSNQIADHSMDKLPENMVVLAKTSTLMETKSDGMCLIKNKYPSNIPTNIRSQNLFTKNINENFMNYMLAPKNLYLLLLEDL